MERLIITLALVSCLGCHRSSEPKAAGERKTVVAPGDAATAHFVGTVPRSRLRIGVDEAELASSRDVQHG